MLKKIAIGFTAGIITGLFGSGGRNDISSSIYLYFKASEIKKQEQHQYFAYFLWYVQAEYFILILHI